MRKYSKANGESRSVYEIITDRIIEKLEQGTVPWHKPWNTHGIEPTNLVSKKPYRGINTFLLGSCAYASPYWVSFNQCKALGGSVKKGERGTPVVFWKMDTYQAKGKDGETGAEILEEKKGFLLRYYTVFNVLQCEDIDEKKIPDLPIELHDHDLITECEAIVAAMPNAPTIRIQTERAFYRPSDDSVNIPPIDTFRVAEEYYSTLFHEMVHSTGHKSRLDRFSGKIDHTFGSKDYSQEELVAEMGAAYLCGHVGIENTTLDNSAAYIEGWLRKFRGDKKVLVFAAAQAHKAADYILGK